MSELGVLDNLVTQFSSPLDCFRELVQNAIDAGTPAVEVWTEFIADEAGHEGTIALHVDDFGEGMDEHIIDEQFTRLFASTKEKDLTKIGKFGIGFVSVFALEPRAVLVETGRGGQYWEVLFHEDRSFSKTKLDVAVEGTQITIFVVGDVHRYRELVAGIEAKLRHWCSHSETEVLFEDRTPPGGGWSEPVAINEPFDVDGHCTTRVSHQGTEIVCAYSTEPVYGFYNRGLTLARTRAGQDVLGDRADRLRHVTFKIKSRYLEHTLSRETVMRDANYEKAMALLVEAVEGPLFDALVGAVVELGQSDGWSLGDVERYGELVGFLAAEPFARIEELEERPLLRCLDGRLVSLADVYDAFKRDGRVLVDDSPGELAGALAGAGVPVLYGPPPARGRAGHPLAAVERLVRRYLDMRVNTSLLQVFKRHAFQLLSLDYADPVRGALAAPGDVYTAVTLDADPPEPVARLVDQAAGLLDAVDAGYSAVGVCRAADGATDAPLFVIARTLGPVMARPPRLIGEERVARRPAAAVNRDHPHLLELVALADHDPQMAAYCLAKSLLLTEDWMLEADLGLIGAADAGLKPQRV